MIRALRRLVGAPLRSVAFDLVTAGGIVLAAVLATAMEHHGARAVPGYVMAVALLGRRRWPVRVFTLVCLAGVAQLAMRDSLQLYDVAVLIALYSVVKYTDRIGWAWAAAGAIVLGAVCYGLITPSRIGIAGVGEWYRRAGMLIIYATPFWLIGLTMRTRRLYVRSLEERATTAERERDQRARLAVADERGRIARELHDVVAHSLAVMIVQADGATYAIEGDPATAKRAVRTVADTGRQALTDMRRLVAVLRGDEAENGAAPVVGADERRSVGLARLDPLLDRFRAAGLEIELDRSGTVRPLPGGIELAGYRIVQESLTNVLKHAGVGTGTRVAVAYRADRVELEITDDGAGRRSGPFSAAPLPGGHGLLGMRERVGVYGGDFAAGPRVGPGWRVAAGIPVPAGPTPDGPAAADLPDDAATPTDTAAVPDDDAAGSVGPATGDRERGDA